MGNRFLFYISISTSTFYIPNLQKNVTHLVAKANCPSWRVGGRTVPFFLDSLSSVAV